ncbi:MAG: hypothetical protein ACKVZ6_14120 [Kineosporiaceae bacterium]|jgi:hypothetical protein
MSETDWPSERRPLPDYLRATAAASPGGYVAEIDGTLIGDPDGFVPAEAVKGVYVVGPDGAPTGDFLRNPGHGPVQDDVARLESGEHWLGWLPAPVGATVKEAVASSLDTQVPGSRLEWFKVVDDLALLTSGLPDPDDATKVTVHRAGMAAPFALSVVPPTGGDRVILTGVVTWVAWNLQPGDGERSDRVWLELDTTIAQGKNLLEQRVREPAT